MDKSMRPPAKNPCGSCPYRKDVPSGVWEEEEYIKLPEYDKDTGSQPPNVFMCHQQDGRICAGWAGCHDMENNLGLRFAAWSQSLTPDEVQEVINYSTTTPLWESGEKAYEHGVAEVEEPGDKAQKIIQKLERKLS